MANDKRRVYWILPLSVEVLEFANPYNANAINYVASLKGIEFSLIKNNPKEDDIVVNTPYGDLIYRPKISKTTKRQMEKTFNVTKTFCNKLYPKVVRKIYGANENTSSFDFAKLEDRISFTKEVINSGVILGITGTETKKGILKRVNPVSPLEELSKMDEFLIENKSTMATDLFTMFEHLIEHIGEVKSLKHREEFYNDLEKLF